MAPEPTVFLVTVTDADAFVDSAVAVAVGVADAQALEASVTSACSMTKRSNAQAVPPPAEATTARAPPSSCLLYTSRCV